MEISSVTASTSTATQASSSGTISSDFETFLKMLTTQLENQDPLNPVDSSDYAVQLATFSSVEQQTLTNQKLDTLAGLMGVQGMTQLAPWVGQEARSAAAVYMDGTPVTLQPNPDSKADSAVLVVKNQSGTTVAREEIPVDTTSYSWTGQSITGTSLPTGTYNLSLESYAQGVQIANEAVESYAQIKEVQSTATGPRIILTGGISLAADEITALRNAQ
jgi:flagellar basal-body rod modification protein FlgD